MTFNTHMSIGDRIKNELAAYPDKSQKGCAAYAGLGKGTLNDIVQGRSQSSTKLHLIAEYLGVTTRWLETGRPPKTPQVSATLDETDTVYTSLPRMSRVHLQGVAEVDKNGCWIETKEVAGGYVDWPGAAGDAYAVGIKGDALHPVIRAGWLVVVEPSWPAQAGDLVLVKFADGRSTVRELLWHRDGIYSLESIDGGTRLTVNASEVGHVHAITGVAAPSKLKQ